MMMSSLPIYPLVQLLLSQPLLLLIYMALKELSNYCVKRTILFFQCLIMCVI